MCRPEPQAFQESLSPGRQGQNAIIPGVAAAASLSRKKLIECLSEEQNVVSGRRPGRPRLRRPLKQSGPWGPLGQASLLGSHVGAHMPGFLLVASSVRFQSLMHATEGFSETLRQWAALR